MAFSFGPPLKAKAVTPTVQANTPIEANNNAFFFIIFSLNPLNKIIN